MTARQRIEGERKCPVAGVEDDRLVRAVLGHVLQDRIGQVAVRDRSRPSLGRACMSDTMSCWSNVVLPMPVLPMMARCRRRSSGRMPNVSQRDRNLTLPTTATSGSCVPDGRSTGGSSSRLTVTCMAGARTVAVAGCQSVASSSQERRNPRQRCRPEWISSDSRHAETCAMRGMVNCPKAPAIWRSCIFARRASLRIGRNGKANVRLKQVAAQLVGGGLKVFFPVVGASGRSGESSVLASGPCGDSTQDQAAWRPCERNAHSTGARERHSNGQAGG